MPTAPTSSNRSLFTRERPSTASARPSPALALIRRAAVQIRAAATMQREEEAAVALYGVDAGVVLRSNVVPTTTTSSDASAISAMALLVTALAPRSAAAGLIQRGTVVDMVGISTVALPSRTATADDTAWIKEADPIPIFGFTGIGTTTPRLHPRKLACGCVYTREVANSSALEQFVRATLSQAVGLALDKKILSNDAEVADTSPAGILQTSPITASTKTGQAALAEDTGKLIKALVDAGGGLDPLFIAHPARAATLRMLAGPRFDYPILTSPALAEDSLAAVEASSFVSGFSGEPELDTSLGATVVMANPGAQISVGGVVAAGVDVRSTYQTDSIALRIILRATWAMIAATHAQVINSITAW